MAIDWEEVWTDWNENIARLIVYTNGSCLIFEECECREIPCRDYDTACGKLMRAGYAY